VESMRRCGVATSPITRARAAEGIGEIPVRSCSRCARPCNHQDAPGGTAPRGTNESSTTMRGRTLLIEVRGQRGTLPTHCLAWRGLQIGEESQFESILAASLFDV